MLRAARRYIIAYCSPIFSAILLLMLVNYVTQGLGYKWVVHLPLKPRPEQMPRYDRPLPPQPEKTAPPPTVADVPISPPSHQKSTDSAVPRPLGLNDSLGSTPPSASYAADEPIAILTWTPVKQYAPQRWKIGMVPFERKCPVGNCLLTNVLGHFPVAQAVIFDLNRFDEETREQLFASERPVDQTWIALIPEPLTSNGLYYLDKVKDEVNVTVGFQHDADLRYQYGSIKPLTAAHVRPPPGKQYAKGKTKKIAWIVSNCDAASPRMEYARLLQKYIQLDIHGKCGNWKCDLTGDVYGREDPCFAMINRTYKFYLAFESHVCTDYVTEIVYRALQWDVIPIVMGGANYSTLLPPHSYIDVKNFTTVGDLAAYLKTLDKNDDLFNSYFAWRMNYYVEPFQEVVDRFFCDLCHYLHRISREEHHHKDLAKWYNKTECENKNVFYNKVNSDSPKPQPAKPIKLVNFDGVIIQQ